MKYVVSALAVLAFPHAACAQAPTPPPAPDAPTVTSVTEDCGENCTRTKTVIRTAKADEDGNAVVTKNVEVIELRTGEEALEDIDIDIDSEGENGAIVRKKVKVITSTDGEMTPEMQAKIDALIADADSGDGYAFKESGDGLYVFSNKDDVKKVKVIVRDGEEQILSSSDNVTVDQVENEDGSRTIRITPNNGEETTIVTIAKEKSSKIDN